MPELPAETYFTLTPDWVCEVLSPSTAQLDRARKLPLYAREAVPWVWLIDPDARTIEALELRDGRYSILATYASDEQARIPPFEAITLDVGGLWRI